MHLVLQRTEYSDARQLHLCADAPVSSACREIVANPRTPAYVSFSREQPHNTEKECVEVLSSRQC